MPDHLDDYVASGTAWRDTLRQNSRRTYYVIALFFIMYLALGLLIDTYLYLEQYPGASISEIFYALLTFQLFPIASIIMLVIASVSLFVSFIMHDRLMLLGTDYHEVTEQSKGAEKQLYNVVEEMKIAAGLHYLPRIFIIEADYMNAFASGYSEKSAMVAITRGLMTKLNRDELQAVMAHELSHIRHLDIKLTITASLLANLTIMVLDIFFYHALFDSGRRSSKGKNGLLTIILIARYLLPLVSLLLLLYLSRKRELMADAGCVSLMRTNQPLASALLKIHQDHQQNKTAYQASYQQTPHENVRRESYIYSPKAAGISLKSALNDIFSTHPEINKRLAILGYKKKNIK